MVQNNGILLENHETTLSLCRHPTALCSLLDHTQKQAPKLDFLPKLSMIQLLLENTMNGSEGINFLLVCCKAFITNINNLYILL
jgi:hypothetical protein